MNQAEKEVKAQDNTPAASLFWVTSVAIATGFIPLPHPVQLAVMCEHCYQNKDTF